METSIRDPEYRLNALKTVIDTALHNVNMPTKYNPDLLRIVVEACTEARLIGDTTKDPNQSKSRGKLTESGESSL